jgi:hypothetical protein
MGIFLGRKAVEPAPRASGDAWGWKPAGIFKAWNHPKLLAIKKKNTKFPILSIVPWKIIIKIFTVSGGSQ